MEYRVREVSELLGVSADTVRRWADAGDIPSRRDTGDRRLIDGPGLAQFIAARAGAADLGGQSARNRLSGIVTEVRSDGVAATVELYAGGFRLVSLLTAEAVEQLGLEPGARATAVVKATNVIIERG